MLTSPEKGDTIKQISVNKSNFIILDAFEVLDIFSGIPKKRILAINKKREIRYFELSQVKRYNCLLTEIIKNEN